MSVNISIKNAIKRYGSNTIIPDLSLDIKEGEFFTLLGPSGCGKTTLLRMIAGFNSIEGGDFYFNNTRINDMEPSKRNIGMVFQNYAIFPHLTVYDNVAFGLKNRKIDKSEMDRRVKDMLDTMQITEYSDRMPERLSGGQQQRVALARAVVIEPDVLLMDEPLSNLDAKLRIDMRTAIKEIQQTVNITTVYVTHDQEEAMSVSDRIAVMNLGNIQQIGTPQNIYQRPANIFVATFIGRSNILDATYDKENSLLKFGDMATLPYEGNRFEGDVEGGDVKVSIRPEEFMILKNNEATSIFSATVKTTVFLGLNTHYTVVLDDGSSVDIVEESAINHIYQEGERVQVGVKTDKINVFSHDGSQNYVKGVVNDNIQ
ncbi:ABC transporter ATP-binding protein [Erysipelothrix sp. HDW6A]|uniref:ABC transporter ATP-binding protein n=1 Tax=Erysipelothrix sp. HDW6A TaxID=2714928 RepID=UPI00140D8D91|nr:ABC transporter ATP-binding protein [Erysipelothrix sp. HDW6A]QIK56923.1 ABC transporter ATP-binding protein [Erysipelothrix sp. HDW6A]